MNLFSSLYVRLVALVFLAVAASLAVAVLLNLSGLLSGVLVGAVALAAAWLGTDLFIVQRVKSIESAANKLAKGDLSSRAALQSEHSELGALARSLATMSENLQRQGEEHQKNESSLL